MTFTSAHSNENDLISLIYDAAVNPTQWRKVLTGVCQVMNADECTIYFYDAQCRARNYANSSSGKDDVINLFLRDHIDTEVALINEHLKHIPSGTVVPANGMLIDDRRYENAFEEDYREALLGELQVRAGIPIIQGRILASAMGIKSFNTSPPISTEALQFLQRLAPHIVQAMHIHNHITSLQTTYTSIKTALNETRTGIFLLSHSGQVIYSNNEAVRIIESNCGLRIVKGGALQHVDNDAQHILRDALLPLLQNINPVSTDGYTITLKHMNSLLPLRVNILPIESAQAQKFSIVAARIAIFIKDPNRPLMLPAEYLRKAYDFSESEISVAQSLLSDPQLQSVSDARSTTLETTRWHVKQITKKTNTHSQAELVQLLTCLAGEL